MYKVVIIDDEHWARVTLRDKLRNYPEIEIVGEADSIRDAKDKLQKYNPDVIFLDIQLTDGTGFDLLNSCSYKGKVIFVTAFDTFAIRAFKINALDYIMKPVSKKRLSEAIERINYLPTPLSKADTMLLKPDDRLMATKKSAIRFIKVADIVLLSSTQDYTKVHTSDQGEYLVTKTMNEWENRLPEEMFCRIHRSYIINFYFIDHVTRLSSNAAEVYLVGFDQPFRVSRSYFYKLKEKYK
ncbi:LytR/AlgR family response regulator transcription factor [Bacteroidota bacterium]